MHAPRSAPSPTTRRTRRRCASARSTCWRSMCSARPAASRSSPMSSMPRSDAPRPMPISPRADFDAVLDFVATGGYALKAYERFAKIRQGKDGRWRISHPHDRAALSHECRHHRRGRHAQGAAGALARLEDDSARRAAARRGRGIFHRDADAGRHFRVRRRNPANTRRWSRTRSMSRAPHPRIPRCRPTKAASFRSRPISPTACARSSPITTHGGRCRSRCANGSRSRNGARCCRGRGDLLVETFPRGDKHYLVCYPFEGRLAHQTLGMLLTRRLERARLRPLGFVANEYALAVWGLGDVAREIERGELSLGAIVRRGHAGRRSRGLARRIRADEAHLPQLRDHRRADRAPVSRQGEIAAARSRSRPTSSTTCCASTSPITCCCAPPAPMRRPACSTSGGWAKCSARIKGRIIHKALDHVSPLAVPVMLEIGREMVYGEASEDAAGGSRGGAGQGGDGVTELEAQRGTHGAREAGGAEIGDRRRRARRRSAPARSIGRRKACSSSPTCISKKARASPRAACCCRPMTRPRRWRGSRALIARYAPRAVIALGDSFHDGDGPARALGERPRGAARAAARARLDLDRRQS